MMIMIRKFRVIAPPTTATVMTTGKDEIVSIFMIPSTPPIAITRFIIYDNNYRKEVI